MAEPWQISLVIALSTSIASIVAILLTGWLARRKQAADTHKTEADTEKTKAETDDVRVGTANKVTDKLMLLYAQLEGDYDELKVEFAATRLELAAARQDILALRQDLQAQVLVQTKADRRAKEQSKTIAKLSRGVAVLSQQLLEAGHPPRWTPEIAAAEADTEF